jgi:hypothetical protein
MKIIIAAIKPIEKIIQNRDLNSGLGIGCPGYGYSLPF